MFTARLLKDNGRDGIPYERIAGVPMITKNRGGSSLSEIDRINRDGNKVEIIPYLEITAK